MCDDPFRGFRCGCLYGNHDFGVFHITPLSWMNMATFERHQAVLEDPESLLDLKDVLKLIPISRASWYRGVARGSYPCPIPFGKRRFWRAGDIMRLRQCGESKHQA